MRLPVILSALALCLSIVVGFVVYSLPSKYAYVDATKLVNEYKGMIDARDAYKKKAQLWKANIDTLSKEVQSQIMQYEKTSSKLSANERKLTEELIRAKQKQLYDYQQAMNSQAQQEDTKMTSEVLVQMNAFIKKYGEKNGYKMIMAATQYGNIAYASESLDITKEVLEELNNEYSGK